MHRTLASIVVTMACSGGLLAACSNEAPQTEASAVATGLANDVPPGIFQVKSRLEDPSGCDPEHLAKPAEYQPFYIQQSAEFLGHPLFSLYSCSDRASCEADAAALERNEGMSAGEILIFHERAGDVIKGEIASTGFLEDGVCKGASVNRVKLWRQPDGDYRMESRVSKGDVPPEGPYCSTDGARNGLASKACEKLTVTVLGI